MSISSHVPWATAHCIVQAIAQQWNVCSKLESQSSVARQIRAQQFEQECKLHLFILSEFLSGLKIILLAFCIGKKTYRNIGLRCTPYHFSFIDMLCIFSVSTMLVFVKN